MTQSNDMMDFDQSIRSIEDWTIEDYRERIGLSADGI